jgi:TonB family protein
MRDAFVHGAIFVLAVAGFAVATPARPAGQTRIPESRSTLAGVVVDASHAALPGVTVALEDIARRATYRVTTDGQGRFQFADLPAADYEAEVVVPGFAVFRESVLVAGPRVEREIVLVLNGIEETFTVVAGAPAGISDVPSRERGDDPPCVARVNEETQSPVGGQIRQPRMLLRVAPVYPEHLREADLGGLVRLAGTITVQGTLDDVTVLEGSHPDFAAAAVDAVRSWTWEETLLNCTPVEVGVTVTVRFVPGRP